ncbi:hypothetical protein BGX28_009418 [Mortierella sp. GBA30]|nr:hypothetical protein BGX28_009418 [Mortierella sp. GBA30]
MRRTRFGSTEQSLKDLNGVAIQDLYDHEHDHKCLDEHEHKHEQYDCHDKTVSMMLPRPRTILLTSLGIWTLLLVLAPQMGLNRSVSVTVWSVDGYDSMMMVSDTISQQQEQQEQYKYENGFDKEWSTGTVWDDEVFQEELEARVRAAEEDDIMDSEGFYLPPKSEQGSQFMEYMEVDFKSEQDDLSALRDFWNAQEEIVTEGYEPMVPSHSDKSTLLTTISGNLDEEVDDQNNYTSNEVVRFIRLFEYKPWWTEGFMFSLALCLGGMLVGLHLAKMEIRGRIAALEKELEDDVNHHDGDVKDQKKARVSNLSRRRRIAAFTWVRGLLTVALLGMNYWMVKSRHWDLPSLYFAGLGCAGMLLVHLWLPKTPDQYVLDSNEKHTITGYLSV